MILLVSIPIVFGLKWLIDQQFEKELEIDLGFGIGWMAAVIGLVIYGVFYLVQSTMIKKYVRKVISTS